MKTTTRKSRGKTATSTHCLQETFFSSHDQLAEHIAVSAYYKAQARGFAPGGELDDWLQAEAELSTTASAT